ncbi:hypothetical protein GCM10022237_14120 [Nocardioides ginsengisoli]
MTEVTDRQQYGVPRARASARQPLTRRHEAERATPADYPGEAAPNGRLRRETNRCREKWNVF